MIGCPRQQLQVSTLSNSNASTNLQPWRRLKSVAEYERRKITYIGSFFFSRSTFGRNWQCNPVAARLEGGH